MRIPREIWIAIISSIIAAITTFYVPKLLTDNDVKLEFATVFNKEFINIPELLNGRVEIFVDEVKQENLSAMDIHLFNRSDRDLKKLPLTFEFYTDNDEPLPQILGKKLTKPDSFPQDSIKEIPQQENQHIRYQISSLPVDDDYVTDFVASFIFLGKELPNVRVQSDYSDGKVIEIKEYDKEARDRETAITGISIMAVFIISVVAFAFWLDKKGRGKFTAKIGRAAQRLDYNDIPKETRKSIAIEAYQDATKVTMPWKRKPDD